MLCILVLSSPTTNKIFWFWIRPNLPFLASPIFLITDPIQFPFLREISTDSPSPLFGSMEDNLFAKQREKIKVSPPEIIIICPTSSYGGVDDQLFAEQMFVWARPPIKENGSFGKYGYILQTGFWWLLLFSEFGCLQHAEFWLIQFVEVWLLQFAEFYDDYNSSQMLNFDDYDLLNLMMVTMPHICWI